MHVYVQHMYAQITCVADELAPTRYLAFVGPPHLPSNLTITSKPCLITEHHPSVLSMLRAV